MKKQVKPKKVIKNSSKITRKKKVNKKKQNDIFLSIINFLKQHIILCLSIIALILIFIVSICVVKSTTLNKKVITINNEQYTKSDFMIYLYSAKYNYFGDGNTDVGNESLDVVIDNDNNKTVRDYLKEETLNEIKTSSSIKQFAYENNIELSKKELNKIKQEKKAFIKKLGGRRQFKKFLRHNHTTELSYDKMSKTDKLYQKILSDLYGKGKLNDLTDNEIKEAKKSYRENYVKIKQVILTIVDTSTGKKLSTTTINQKKALAEMILEKARNGKDFDSLISKYSEDAQDEDPPYDVYYERGELLSEIEEVAFNLDFGEIGDVIETKYAFHIIQKQELDDAKLNDYYDKQRENKCLSDLNEYMNQLKIIYHDSYDKIKIK